jgi:hypothetical protein
MDTVDAIGADFIAESRTMRYSVSSGAMQILIEYLLHSYIGRWCLHRSSVAKWATLFNIDSLIQVFASCLCLDPSSLSLQ